MTACTYYCMVVVTKAIFSYDLRDVQYPLHTLELSALGFIRDTRHMLVASIARSKDCRITSIIERGKGYVILLIFVFINQNVYNQGSFVALKIFNILLFSFIYLHAPRVRVYDISVSVYCMVMTYFNLLYFSFNELSSD